MYRPSELRAFLDSLGISPKKNLSQNFIIDGNILRKIVHAANIQSNDILVEIGPGPGSLTQMLLETGATVVAIEKDEILANALTRLQTSGQQLKVYSQDVLDFSFVEELTPLLKNGQRAKVIANLPYHLTTPILVRLVKSPDLFSSLTVMVQEEVARRFIAKPGTSEYGSFTVFLRFFASVTYEFTVSRRCFFPVPGIDSAVVSLVLREPPLHGEEQKSFFQLTRTAFEHRRKMLRSSLKDLYHPEKVEASLESIGLSPLSRPEVLSLEEFLQLHAHLKKTD